jgi:hypothetical protein
MGDGNQWPAAAGEAARLCKVAGEDMARANDWASKVMALVNGGNASAAIAQIKVAPSVKDLKALQTIMTLSKMKGRYPNVDAAVADNLALLAAPRLHRSP